MEGRTDGLQLKFFDKLPFCHHPAYRELGGEA